MTRPSPLTLSCAASALAFVLATGLQAVAQEWGFTGPADFSAPAEARLPSVAGIIATGAAPSTTPSQQPMLPPGLQDFFGFKMPDRAPEGPGKRLDRV